MSQMSRARPRFYGYPKPKEGPDVKYANAQNDNPSLRGSVLVLGSWIVSNLGFLQTYLWRNAGFGGLRRIADLSDYHERFDCVVIPILEPPTPLPDYTEAASFKTLPKDLAGRYHSAADYHAMYLSGELTPLAVAEFLLPLIRKDIDPKNVHSVAFVDSRVDLVMEAATASTERYKLGKSLGVLDGVPLAIKDETDIAGYRTMLGRKRDDNLYKVKTETSWPVMKWQEAGAVVVGKVNMHELGTDTTNLNVHWGTPLNPFNDQYFTGGSSGGSAYAVSTGLVPIAFGADAGGSIRLPSSFCGVYGLKPSQGRIGETSISVCVLGPLAATISDLEVAYRVMAQPEPLHPVSSLFPQPRPHAGQRAKIIGIYQDWFDRADPAIRAVCSETIEYLVTKQGYRVVKISIPYLPEGQRAHAMLTLAEMAALIKEAKPQSPERYWLTDLGAATKILAMVGSQTPAFDYILAAKMRSLLMSHIAFLYEQYPGMVIVTPTSPMSGWPIAQQGDLVHGVSDGNSSIRNMEYIWLANYTGCPAITAPAGYIPPVKGHGELPVGIMAMGEWGSEDALIEWGRDVEKYLVEEYPGGRRYPLVWEDVIQNAKATTVRGG